MKTVSASRRGGHNAPRVLWANRFDRIQAHFLYFLIEHVLFLQFLQDLIEFNGS
jgi:hypothetical protein